MGRENNRVGRIGEDIAEAFLRRRGYRIIERNYRTPFGELDLIAKHGAYVVFVEVKTRTGDSFGPPSLSITWDKRKRLVKNALCYLAHRGRRFSCWRIDVVSVMLDASCGFKTIELIENAVEDHGY